MAAISGAAEVVDDLDPEPPSSLEELPTCSKSAASLSDSARPRPRFGDCQRLFQAQPVLQTPTRKPAAGDYYYIWKEFERDESKTLQKRQAAISPADVEEDSEEEDNQE
ncbi:unnamed protein product [Clonostachys rhizophaga]|uniref:Uncharacterized protein n=1 Tax=Clonostachys rhizophaga TaxID=160324 RepID=A0A9N9YIG0_9HYPO|nr:unnamed protein product [Clonostachys rhizophaga]